MKDVIVMHPESANNLATWMPLQECDHCLTGLRYLSYAPNVFVPGLLVETEVLVQTKSYVVAI